LSKRKSVLSLLDDTSFLGTKPVTLPMDPNLKHSLNDGDSIKDPSIYR